MGAYKLENSKEGRIDENLLDLSGSRDYGTRKNPD